MAERVKPQLHHWWPKCVSKHWADADGKVGWLLPSGEVRRSTPENFGAQKDGHTVRLGVGADDDTPWDYSFESEFDAADNSFPSVLKWLDELERKGPPFEAPHSERIVELHVEDQQFTILIEFLVSLAARSPMHREKGVGLAESLRGPLEGRERRSLIGVNIQSTLKNALRNLNGSGKALVLYSAEQEFIFGDGFFQNLTHQGDHWSDPKMLVPLTPWMAVLYARPNSYRTLPKLCTMAVSQSEAKALNYAVQVYSKNAIFFRSQCPTAGAEYSQGRHMRFASRRNTVQELIHKIPGIPPPDPNLDRLEEMFRGTKK